MADAHGDATGALSETEILRRRLRELERVVAERSASASPASEPLGDRAAAGEETRAPDEQFQAAARSARDLVHLLSNDLTLAVGYIELLRAHAALPAELRELVQGAAGGLAAASQHLERLHRDLRAASEPPGGS